MKRSVIALEWKLNRRGWCISSAVVVAFLAMFAGVADLYTNNEDIVRLIESYPPAMLAAVGIDPIALTTFEGWMSTQPYTFYILLLGVFGAMWAATSIAKERDRETAEWLFALPYSRSQIFLSKVGAHWLQVTGIYLLSAAVALGFGYATTDVRSPGVVALFLTAGYLVALAFSGVGFALTAAFRSERSANSAAVGLVVVSFALNMLNGMHESVAWLAKLSLFQAFDRSRILADAALTPSGLVVTVMIYVAGVTLGWIMLRRQDV